MKKIILLLLVLFVAFVIYNRHRLFLRDPLGSLARGGVKEQGAQIFVNFANDVLIENDNTPSYLTLLQHDRPVGTPKVSMCIHFVACLLDADQATLTATAFNAHIDAMSNKSIVFTGGDGRPAEVTLR